MENSGRSGRAGQKKGVEDAIEHLCFIAKVNKGIKELDSGLGVPHDEAKRQILGG